MQSALKIIIATLVKQAYTNFLVLRIYFHIHNYNSRVIKRCKNFSLTIKLKMVFSVLCFFFKTVSWHLLLYQFRYISKEHSPIKSHVPCAPFILWAPAPPKVSARPCKLLNNCYLLRWWLAALKGLYYLLNRYLLIISIMTRWKISLPVI